MSCKFKRGVINNVFTSFAKWALRVTSSVDSDGGLNSGGQLDSGFNRKSGPFHHCLVLIKSCNERS